MQRYYFFSWKYISFAFFFITIETVVSKYYLNNANELVYSYNDLALIREQNKQ
ncbi:MAG: hypothetical protein LBE13_05875 [Bacteroidales bacterium]|jgi:hypothetical protein|nr:hypothetical protein [Bacteroidales bacterium]